MYFNKIRHPSNFDFAPAAPARARIDSLGGDVFRLRVPGARLWKNPSQALLAERIDGADTTALAFAADGTLSLAPLPSSSVSAPLLTTTPGATFGRCGATWMLQFRHHPELRFYGLGEHSSPGLEKTAQRVKFWNTDLWGDFSLHEIRHAHPNPQYVSIPYVAVRTPGGWVGLLVHHPGAVFMDLASNFVWEEGNYDDLRRGTFFVGAPDGDAEVYFLAAPDLAGLTRKLQTLVGRTPLPPLWALGHHQCRWGYASAEHLLELDREFTRHRIPTDGLWLDIDYMERYKVFTFAPEHWSGGDQTAVRRALAVLAKKGRRVVPILDPGVKVEPGYAVCDGGLRAGVFCLNPAGKPFVGFVWPGHTHMPDFSRAETREWWAGHVRDFAALGVAGAWLDMNDPSVGAVELDDMLFDRGRQPHEAYHNQYALGMAEASRAGFLAARPDERPFLLSRSAFISSSRHTAVWTGDNVANWHHLRGCIPLTLNLALSGQPFNGPDVAGFGDDTTPELAIAWYRAGHLFPFFRNHALRGTRRQEPWALGAVALRVIGRYIRLRYKLLPYLYQNFVRQEESGEALLRPLCHDFSDTPAAPVDRVSDQFLIGRDLLQAPLVHERARHRPVVLPGAGLRWFGAHDGRWHAGDRTLPRVPVGPGDSPLYVREGALVPMRPGMPEDNRTDLADIELHLFLRRDTAAESSSAYAADDGLSFAYQRGERTRATFHARVAPDGALELRVADYHAGWRPLRLRLVCYDKFSAVRLSFPGGERRLTLRPATWTWTGRPLAVHRSAPLALPTA